MNGLSFFKLHEYNYTTVMAMHTYVEIVLVLTLWYPEVLCSSS
jgi:hypothetical protein